MGWLKEEIRTANAPTAADEEKREDSKIFTTPQCLDTLAPHLFISPGVMDHQTFEQHMTFFLDVLNLVYFLLSVDGLSKILDLDGAFRDTESVDIKSWFGGFDEAIKKFGREGGGEEGIGLLEAVMSMCRGKIGWTGQS